MMSRELGFFGRYILLLIIQLLLCNYFMLSPYVMLTLLPAMVLSIPLRYATPQVLLIAFVTALAVDFLADGVPGLNVPSCRWPWSAKPSSAGCSVPVSLPAERIFPSTKTDWEKYPW